MRVLALTKYGRLGGSSRVRTFQYLPAMDRAGLNVTVRPLLGNGYLERRYSGEKPNIRFLLSVYAGRLKTTLSVRRYDLVWIEKEVLPWVPGLVERGLLRDVPYVLDLDDAAFHTYDQHDASLVRRILGQKIDDLMRGAAAVVAGNAYLAERAVAAGANRVEILPSVVDLETYGPVAPFFPGPFTIGWIGSPGSERLLGTIHDVLKEITEQPGVRLMLVGAQGHALEGVDFDRRPWSEDTEVESMQQFHVGIMPLTDTPWERGKCGYKLVQCMAAGRPVVASPVGVNRDIVTHGHDGFLADSCADWREALDVLRTDRPRAADMGRNGRRRIEKDFALSVTAPRLVRLLKDVARG